MNKTSIVRPLGALGKAALALGIAVLLAAGAPEEAAAAAPKAAGGNCAGEAVRPSQDLAAVAAGRPAATTFCLRDGTYEVTRSVAVQDGDRFVGSYSDGSRPVVKTSQARAVFEGAGSEGATIQNLAITGAAGDDACEPNCGRGISHGTNTTVANVLAYGNANQGIGAMGPGLLVKDSVLTKNGSASFTDLSGPRSAAGLKTVNSFTVVDTVVKDNFWNGVWCDEECNDMVVRGSTITGNGKTGISYEISSGPNSEIHNNVISGNGHKDTYSREAEVLVGSSSGLEVYGNAFGLAANDAVLAYEDERGTLGGISVHDNRLNGDTLKGCDLAGVSC